MMQSNDKRPASRNSSIRTPCAVGRGDVLAVLLIAIGLAARIAGLPFHSQDAINFLIPWYGDMAPNLLTSIVHYRGNYNFPYIYLLWVFSWVFGPTRPLLAIKALSVLADVTLSLSTALVVKRAGAQISGLWAFALVWCIPTVVINSSVWGQCDAIYTTFLVASVLAAMQRRGALAVALAGVSISFKLQAIFIAPFFVFLLWERKLRLRTIIVGLAVIIVMLIPAAIAGKSLRELLMVYVSQAGAFHELALSAPNLWSILKHIGPIERWQTVAFWSGLVVTVGACVGYVLLGKRMIGNDRQKSYVEVAFVAAFICPFLLPRMHDRYFFASDVLAAAMAIIDRRWTTAAALVQVGSLTAYSGFLLGLRWPLAIGILSNSAVCCAILVRWLKERIQVPICIERICRLVVPIESGSRLWVFWKTSG